ncbi:hypothetical protein LXT21_44340 [Myxococcus sp. K38C18041901]|uniref:hypothetical protein n=1 Tax=Myxococcus guangdongensis TaxID=2906760 RepID=UPI0020A76934|nr:hypothetical protein [Myxococcus guangdongensis]MCP3065820.1 hypothetical protein [Myxococcus guangdongensis]
MTPCPSEPCTVDGCTREAAPRRKLCHAHAKRATRGQPLSTPLAETYANPWDRLTSAALAYADAGDDEEAFAKAKDRLRKASISYSQGLQRPESAPSPRMRKVPTEGQLELWPGEAAKPNQK